MIELTPAQRRAFRASAHSLHPVVSISQKGLTESVLTEIDRCLNAHELIKIRVYVGEREQREAYLAQIAAALSCAPVQHIGNVLILWRAAPDKAAVQPKPRAAQTARMPKRRAGQTSAPRRRAASR